VAWFEQVVRMKDKITKNSRSKIKREDYTKRHKETAFWDTQSIFFLGVAGQ
jgi:hypothetical protein